jgi:hypothetical protein
MLLFVTLAIDPPRAGGRPVDAVPPDKVSLEVVGSPAIDLQIAHFATEIPGVAVLGLL